MTQIWIMTIPCEELSKRELLFRLRRRARRWQFGIEVGSHSGYEHYQVRYECSNGDIGEERGYWGDITCNLLQAGGWSEYECKDGDFYRSMDDELGKYRFARLKDLQLYILALSKKEGDRNILLVVDKRGGSGKTFLGRWCDLNGQGIYIDGSGSIGDINRDLFDITESRQADRILLDLTRQCKFTAELWAGIERIKNGYLVDTRYNYRSKWIAPPKVIVFANHQPADWDGLSTDRWQRLFIEQDPKYETHVRAKYYPTIGGRAVVRSFKS